MDQEVIRHIVDRVLAREFDTRIALAQTLGHCPSWVSGFSREVIKAGIVDAKTWRASFKSNKRGARGKDKNPRKSAGLVEAKRRAASERLRQTLQVQLQA